jgi:hypothetical protein
MSLEGVEPILKSVIQDNRSTLYAQPQLLHSSNRKLLRTMMELGNTLNNDNLILLSFCLREMLSIAETLTDLKLKEKLKQNLPSKLAKANLAEGEVAPVVYIAATLSLDDVSSTTGIVDARNISRLLEDKLKILADESHRTIALGEIIRSTEEVLIEVTQEVTKEVTAAYDEIVQNISNGFDSIREVIEKYIIKLHKKVMEIHPAVGF